MSSLALRYAMIGHWIRIAQTDDDDFCVETISHEQTYEEGLLLRHHCEIRWKSPFYELDADETPDLGDPA